MVPPQPRAAVAPQAGELAKHPHLTTLAGRALAGHPTTTRMTTQAATEIVVSASLLRALLTTTLRAAAGGAEALAAVHLVARAVLVVPPVGVAIWPGKRFGRL